MKLGQVLAMQELPFLPVRRRIEMTEIASVPSPAATTVTTVPPNSPIAMKRPAFAGTLTAAAKNSSVRSAKSKPCFSMVACRFRSSQTIFT